MIRFEAETARRLAKAFTESSEEYTKETSRALRSIHAAVDLGRHNTSVKRLQPETIAALKQAGYSVEVCDINYNYNIISW